MRKLLTADDNSNNFVQDEAHRIEGDKHRQEIVFERGGFAIGLPKTQHSPTTNPQARQRQRDRLERLTNKFLRVGGAITVCPAGKPPRLRFGAFKPPSTSPGSSRNGDLSRRRWDGPLLDKRQERELIRRYRDGDEVAKQRLLEAFHRFVLSIAGEFSGPPHNDLMAAGLFGFCEALKPGRFNENRGYRLSTYARHWIQKYIRQAIKDWRREGAAGETRQDRYVFSNPNATPEQVVAEVGGTLADAEKAIARLDIGHEHYSSTDADYDEDDNPKARPAASHEMHRLFDAFSYGQPSLKQKVVLGSSPLGWIDDLADYFIKEPRRILNRINRRQYALELVERERIRVAFRAKPERYLYRDGSGLKDYAELIDRKSAWIRAAKPPSIGETCAALCQEKKDRAQELEELAASHRTIRKYDPYKELRPTNEKSRRSSFRAPAVCFVWRDDGTEIGKRNARLMAARLSKTRGKIWQDTQTTTREKSLPLPCPQMLPVRRGSFANENFSVSATFAELHCSAI